MRKKRNASPGVMGTILPAAAALAAVLWFFTALSGLDGGQQEEGRRKLEDSLRRSCVACYATEGIYPPTLDYLKEHYGLQIDETRYAVFYDIFAENLMPDITVLERET